MEKHVRWRTFLFSRDCWRFCTRCSLPGGSGSRPSRRWRTFLRVRACCRSMRRILWCALRLPIFCRCCLRWPMDSRRPSPSARRKSCFRLLDILQSIPVLSFLPGVMLAMVALFPRQPAGAGTGFGPADFHRAGVEHRVQLLRFAERHSARAGRGCALVSLQRSGSDSPSWSCLLRRSDWCGTR